jgi:hypothetical protein
MPSGKQITVKAKFPAGSAAATAEGEYHAKKTRSVKIMIVHDTVDAINGNAIFSVSFSPPRQFHQFGSFRGTQPSQSTGRRSKHVGQ